MANEKRLIDVEAIARKLKYAHCSDCHIVRQIQCSACWVNDVLELLDGDSVDAVEVVRCKDCKHWKPSGSMAGNTEYDLQPIGGCKWVNCCRKANDFCSYGERRTE